MKLLVAVFSGSHRNGFFRLRWFAFILLGLSSLAVMAERVPPGTDDEISARLAPFGSLCKAGEDCGQNAAAVTSSGPRTGQQVYDTSCMACHAVGVSGAPKFGNAGDWAARIEKGADALWSSTQNGFNVMPPRGTCMDCSDEELRAAMDYMVDAAR